MRPFHQTPLSSLFTVEQLVTLFYQELPALYPFEEERHDFWELIYLDKGEMELLLDGVPHCISEGQLLFYAPGVCHSCAGNTKACRVAVISFGCSSPEMEPFRGALFRLSDQEKKAFAELIEEGAPCFEPAPENGPTRGLVQKREVPPFKLQFIKNKLELFLLLLANRSGDAKPAQPVNQQNYFSQTAQQIESYLQSHLHTAVTLEEIAGELGLSVSSVKKIFHSQFQCGVIDYFSGLKIDEAKRLIRQSSLNFTQIAHTLGFDSLHYFSKAFKNRTGMTPTQYSRSLHANGPRK